jgi:hypothetical protein
MQICYFRLIFYFPEQFSKIIFKNYELWKKGMQESFLRNLFIYYYWKF